MTDKVTEKINDCLDVYVEEADEITHEIATLSKNEIREDDIKDDYDKRREVLYDLIEKGNKALDSSLQVASGSMHPRAFEVVSQLSKTLVDANKDLLDIQKKVKDLKKTEEKEAPKNVTNALFVGSTAELQKLVNGRSEDGETGTD